LKILVFDPGESTGWVFWEEGVVVSGGTCGKNHREVADKILTLKPDIVVFERFNLYPGRAQSLSWNTFYPCEVIGVIRYIAESANMEIVEQAPSVKKYSGLVKKNESWLWNDLKARMQGKVTEHTWDALQHLQYYLRNGGKAYGLEPAPLRKG